MLTKFLKVGLSHIRFITLELVKGIIERLALNFENFCKPGKVPKDYRTAKICIFKGKEDTLGKHL